MGGFTAVTPGGMWSANKSSSRSTSSAPRPVPVPVSPGGGSYDGGGAWGGVSPVTQVSTGGGGVSYAQSPAVLSSPGAIPGSGGGGAVPQMTGLPNSAQRDPEMTSFMQQMRGRIGQQMGREGQTDQNLQTQVNRLGQRLSTDTTQRAQDFAAQDIGARSRAAAEGQQEDLVRRGVRGDTGMAAELNTRLREKGLQESARSAAGIALGREAQLDQLVLGGQGIMAAPGQMALAREGMTNELLGTGFNQAGAIAGQNLADRTLGVNQWGEQNRFNLGAASLAQTGRDAEIARLMALTRMGGY